MEKLKFENLKINQRVVDLKNKKIGKIIKIDDIHNVSVKYFHGGFGIHCLDKKCSEYDPLYKYKKRKMKFGMAKGLRFHRYFCLIELDGHWWDHDDKKWLTNDEARKCKHIKSNGPHCFTIKAFKRHIKKHNYIDGTFKLINLYYLDGNSEIFHVKA